MKRQQKKLGEVSFSEVNRALDSKIGDIICFQSYTSIIMLNETFHKDTRDTIGLYRRVRRIAQRYSEAEMPEMHSLIKLLERDYPHLKH